MRALILLLAAASAAFAQPDLNGVTITVSRQLNIQPDQVSLTVDVFSYPNQTLDNVLTFLKGTGIGAADLSNVSTLAGQELEWVFTPTLSFSDLNATVAALAALPSTYGAITVSYFYVNATASPQAVSSQACPYPALINDARTAAENLAAAAGMSVGPIVSMEQGSAAAPAVWVSANLLYGVPEFTTPYQAASSPCTLTVHFKLGQ